MTLQPCAHMPAVPSLHLPGLSEAQRGIAERLPVLVELTKAALKPSCAKELELLCGGLALLVSRAAGWAMGSRRVAVRCKLCVVGDKRQAERLGRDRFIAKSLLQCTASSVTFIRFIRTLIVHLVCTPTALVLLQVGLLPAAHANAVADWAVAACQDTRGLNQAPAAKALLDLAVRSRAAATEPRRQRDAEQASHATLQGSGECLLNSSPSRCSGPGARLGHTVP